MGAEATLLLKPAAQDMVLEVGLIVPLEQLPSPPSVTLLLNDAPLDQFVVDDRNIQKRYEVARSAQGSGNVSLKIRTSQTFVPREKDSGSQDGRRLGLIVSSVQWTPK
jgi:hypothetical protein